MFFIRSSTSKRCTLLSISISLDSEIISPYSCYAKKGLVYIVIAFPFSCQPSSYSEYIKANTCLSCDVRLIPLNKYIFSCLYTNLCSYYSL